MNLNQAKELIKLKLSYEFKDLSLLRAAITHSSHSKNNNEVLEFLGDSLLNVCVSEIVFDLGQKTQKREGSLTKKKAMIVDNRNLASTIKKMGLQDILMVAKNQKVSNSMQADLFESIIGAIFLDSKRSHKTVKKIIKGVYFKYWKKLNFIDYKSSIQEITQKEFRQIPDYRLLGNKGSEFVVGLFLGGKLKTKGIGRSKKEAEQRAAKKLYFKLKNPEPIQ